MGKSIIEAPTEVLNLVKKCKNESMGPWDLTEKICSGDRDVTIFLNLPGGW